MKGFYCVAAAVVFIVGAAAAENESENLVIASANLRSVDEWWTFWTNSKFDDTFSGPQ